MAPPTPCCLDINPRSKLVLTAILTTTLTTPTRDGGGLQVTLNEILILSGRVQQNAVFTQIPSQVGLGSMQEVELLGSIFFLQHIAQHQMTSAAASWLTVHDSQQLPPDQRVLCRDPQLPLCAVALEWLEEPAFDRCFARATHVLLH